MPEEYACSKEEYILRFNNVEEAICFVKEIRPDSTAWKEMLLENEGEETWICVLAICDICMRHSMFFAPSCIYDGGIAGVECSECGNMSVYPKEGSFEDED